MSARPECTTPGRTRRGVRRRRHRPAPDGATIYGQAIKGTTAYRVPPAARIDAMTNDKNVAPGIEEFGENGVADGLVIGRQGGPMYVSAPEEDAVKIRDLAEGAQDMPEVLVQDARLRWPDTIGEGPDGSIDITSSRIQDSAFFKPRAAASLPAELWRIVFEKAAVDAGQNP